MPEYNFYSLDNIKKIGAQYNIAYGERSNGKTSSGLQEIIDNYCQKGEQGVYIRRWDDDLKPKTGGKLFDSMIIERDYINKASNGQWNTVVYKNREWYMGLDYVNNKGDRVTMRDSKPFCYGIALTMSEHYKSTSFPNVTTIVFDEFMARGQTFYLEDEFVTFCNLLSTIIRQRDNVTIYMFANSISMYGCPYVEEMGLKNMKTQKKDTIDVYTYGKNSQLKVAVEYSDSISPKGKASDVYFAFDNPKLQMITGEGSYAIPEYPHLPAKYTPENVVYRFFIKYDDELMQCEVVQLESDAFIFVHRKTTILRDEDNDLIYSTDYTIKRNWHRNILRPTDKIQKIIANLIVNDRIFFQNNMLGECFNSYYKWCRQN